MADTREWTIAPSTRSSWRCALGSVQADSVEPNPNLIQPVALMLRCSYTCIVLIATLTALTAVLARSQPLPPAPIKPQTAIEPLTNPMLPVCYIQLENGQLRDLRRFCGKKSTSPAPSRSVQRSVPQSAPDSDDDDSTPTAKPTPQATPAQPSPANSPSPQATPTRAVPQPTASPVPDGRPTNVQSAPTPPPITAPSPPNPLSIREERD